MLYDAWFSELYVFDDGVPGFYIRIPRHVCKERRIRSRMVLTVMTWGFVWSAPCELRISPNRHYIRVPSRIVQSCGFLPGEALGVRLVSVASPSSLSGRS